MIRGVIFDLDGVLLDSLGIWQDLGARYLRSLGLVPQEGLGQILFSMSLEEGCAYLRETYRLPQSAEDIQKTLEELLGTFYREEAQPLPGALYLLEQFRAHGVPMVLATSTPRELTESALERLGFLPFFRHVLTTSEVGESKHSPAIYLAGADLLGTVPEETLAIEDSLYALTTAKNAGFRTVGVCAPMGEADQAGLRLVSEQYLSTLCDFDFSILDNEKGDSCMKTALTIAGSDSSGGAGIQADIKTMLANGVYAMSAITALTAQNTTGVKAILNASPEFVGQELDCIFTDIYPDAVKIGMVSEADIVRIIAKKLRAYKARNIVVDPVMVATSGAKLISEEAIAAMEEELFPLADIITPNIPEAQVLSGMAVANREDMIRAARIIAEKFGCAVLCKGGHRVSDANDLLYREGQTRWFESKRIDNPNTHGTGCTLSSAIASNLAKGATLEEAVQKAKEYISGALSAMLDLGHGSGPMDHGFAIQSPFASRYGFDSTAEHTYR